METKHQVHNLIILDESGSMESIKKTIIQGFNEIVQTVKGIEKEFPEQEHFIMSFVMMQNIPELPNILRLMSQIGQLINFTTQKIMTSPIHEQALESAIEKR